jgi:glycerate-2-kinase
MPAEARESQFLQMRTTAREIFRHALTEASISSAFSRHVHCERGIFRICEDLYDLHSYSRIVVVSIGKAAHSMAEVLTQHIGQPAPENPPHWNRR